LISVSGIGPKLAITVLSGLPTSDLIYAIRNAAVEQLVRIPGVGKKTAERIGLERKDKLEGGASAAGPGQIEKPMAILSVAEQDVILALLNLGCNRSTAEGAVRKAKAAGIPGEFEPLFRKSLELVR